VFIDETWAKTNMARTHGWWRRGAPLRAHVPHGHWRTMTFLAALRNDGITAPCVFDGPINGESFRAYVEQVLVPTLKPGDIVVMDNLGSHRAGRSSAIRAVGARLVYLPPYAGPQRHRAGLRQLPACCAREERTMEGSLAAHRQPPPRLHVRRMRQLLPQRRICFNLVRKAQRGGLGHGSYLPTSTLVRNGLDHTSASRGRRGGTYACGFPPGALARGSPGERPG
jgi:hypothetical protein